MHVYYLSFILIMDAAVNYWAVLAAAVVAWVVGWLWYGPLFGKKWMAWSGLTMDKMKAGLSPKISMLLGLGTSFLMSWVVAHLVSVLGVYEISAIKEFVLWTWAGFFVPMTIGAWLWEGKPFRLFLLNAVYYLVVLDVIVWIVARWA